MLRYGIAASVHTLLKRNSIYCMLCERVWRCICFSCCASIVGFAIPTSESNLDVINKQNQ